MAPVARKNMSTKTGLYGLNREDSKIKSFE